MPDLRELFLQVNSPSWMLKKKAREELYKRNTERELIELFDFVKKEESQGNQMTLLDHLEQLMLKEQATATLSHCLLILSKLSLGNHEKVKTRSRLICGSFLSSKKTYRFQKIISIRKVWNMLSIEERELLTHMIGKFYYVELSSLLLKNLKTKNKKVLLKTIDVLIVLSEKRALPVLRQIIFRDIETKLLVKILDAFSELGNMGDVILIRKFFHHDDFEVRYAAYQILQKRLGFLSFSFLKKQYEKEENLKNQSKVLQLIGDISSKSVDKFLVKEFLSALDVQKRTVISWIFMKKNYRKIVRILNKSFYGVDERKKQLILELYSEVYDSACFYILKDVLLRDSYSFLSKVTALETLSTKSTKEVDDLLLLVLKESDEVLITYCLTACLKSPSVDKKEVLKIVYSKHDPIESEVYTLILRFFSYCSEDILTHESAVSIVCDQLSSLDETRITLALSVSHRFKSRRVFDECLRLTSQAEFKKKAFGALARSVELGKLELLEVSKLLSHELFCEELEKLDGNEEFFKTILLALFREKISFDSFSSQFNNKLLKYAIKEITEKINLKFFNSCLYFLLNSKLYIPKDSLDNIYSRVYHLVDLEKKELILQLLSKKGTSQDQLKTLVDELIFLEGRISLNSKKLITQIVESN